MLNFRKITTDDIPTIEKYTRECGIRSCDFTLCGIYLWGIYYGYEMCVYNDTMFIKGHDESGRPAFAVPVGAMQGKDAVAVVREYCETYALEARFSFVPAETLEAFEGGKALKLEDWSDYIYSAESLSSLAGKKLHRKKNRFNKFVKTYPDYRFERITESNIGELAEFYKRFLAKNPSDSERLSAEETIIERLIAEFSLLGLVGGMIKVDNNAVAFAFGEQIGETLYVHFEKADRDFDGAYEAMNCLFVRNFGATARIVDREEDMGDEGLRAAKRSYCPIGFVDKYEVVF